MQGRQGGHNKEGKKGMDVTASDHDRITEIIRVEKISEMVESTFD